MNRRSCTPVVALSVLVVALLACGNPAPEWQLRGWTVTPSPFLDTHTPVVLTIKETAVVVWTTTPQPTPTATRHAIRRLCITATEAVYLRPSPGTDNYPIIELANGTEVEDLGGRNGNWMFVSLEEKQGWLNRKYVQECK